jgi:hypothetical protein
LAYQAKQVADAAEIAEEEAKLAKGRLFEKLRREEMFSHALIA